MSLKAANILLSLEFLNAINTGKEIVRVKGVPVFPKYAKYRNRSNKYHIVARVHIRTIRYENHISAYARNIRFPRHDETIRHRDEFKRAVAILHRF